MSTVPAMTTSLLPIQPELWGAPTLLETEANHVHQLVATLKSMHPGPRPESDFENKMQDLIHEWLQRKMELCVELATVMHVLGRIDQEQYMIWKAMFDYPALVLAIQTERLGALSLGA
ncbi:hypothetical protein CspHIS471_0411060 [Cutaneotrichosporon sp. HIS471]|nr:hypothetical protein CspHIS471_0411060 [Cutaneotrichosporon sp. HIS471]